MPETFVIPLESNPDVQNKYLQKLGVSDNYQLVDVYGLDDDVLNFIPRPVKAVILLFPCSDAYEAHKKKLEEELGDNPPKTPEGLFYMRQIIRNSCGTMALVHAVFNNLQSLELKDGSVLKNFYDKAKGLSPEERGKLLEGDKTFIDIHQALAAEGQTEAPPSEAKVNHHYIALVSVGGELFELDGTKKFPISHGPTSDDTFLSDAARVCKQFMERDPDDSGFSIMALSNAN